MATAEKPSADKADMDFPISTPTLENLQYWTGVIGSAQQMMLEHLTENALKPRTGTAPGEQFLEKIVFGDHAKLAVMQSDLWTESVALWQRFLSSASDTQASLADRDRRFSAPQWRENPVFDLIRQSYLLISDHLLRSADAIGGLEPRQHDQVRFAMRTLVEAMAPSNFPFTNPQVIERVIETRGENLLKGLERMLTDITKGQLTHTDPNAFEIGRNIAATPGKVIRETPLYQLIQYTPTTETVGAIPLLIFPPWINRFYILDLNPENSFIRWAVEQGLSVFVVSWKSADSSMAELTMDDYVLRGQVDAIDAVRGALGVEQVHAIGYCVAGTTLAMTLAWLEANGQADKVASATFFTAQVDFEQAGELKVFVDDEQLELVSTLAKENGYLDGRYMALTFNLLRGRDLIWSYVVNNYLLAQDYPTFDLLHWNGDTTNLPAKWHRHYLEDLYRDNKLAKPGAVSIADTPIDLRTIKTPAYVQAGREDHIAPLESVWRITQHLSGPIRFVLAGSGHIAGVVNPPSANKYQYWTNEAPVKTLDAFMDGAVETKGSWWPDWREWIKALSADSVPAKGARIPGKGKVRAIEDAPGSYVKAR